MSTQNIQTKDYEYHPLPSAQTHIRLLSLLPRSNTEPIPLTLKTVVPLNEATNSYDAISYTWDSFLPVHEVSLDGRRLWLRENIWRFLLHCSSTRLAHEGDIRAGDAGGGVVGDGESDVFVGGACGVEVGSDGGFFEGEWATTGYDQSVLDPALDRAGAGCAVFVSGTELCDINAFFRLGTLPGQFFQVGDHENTEWKAAAKQIDRLFERHLARETQSPFQGLASLVEEFAAQQCCDPHDHVYGLLGLLEGGQELVIDYKSDMEVLFWQVLTATHQQMSAMSPGARRDSWYYYGDLSILLSADLTFAQLAYVSDPLNVAYAGDIFAPPVETRQFAMTERAEYDPREASGDGQSWGVAVSGVFVREFGGAVEVKCYWG
ncbi:hypothetical protein M409DRAFT_58467 [Zasmidium cellare ATCC 36951]|uniref:Heterokaryon incompatibility domain-containing protein n=1 Tax=Zasmidium cellare ATCC 36951 TaxID=1080233 RepID=A0A6A6C658_ZASCE|nr:uncharacterized protein M409DRAFT_58467 [Zasmidium cellare ATCC 36951]KAF2162373.1 hypothetical protein M409DRAFT_58467 [Zasmidium cellare ATCC 36951]